MEPKSIELVFVLIMMSALLVFAFAAVFIFLRVMRKEQRAKEALKAHENGSNSNDEQ